MSYYIIIIMSYCESPSSFFKPASAHIHGTLIVLLDVNEIFSPLC